MGTAAILGSLTGLAFSSGLRLYSTVLVVGLGLRFGLLELPPALDDLQVLATTPILVIAGVAYLIEFLADKIPWVDSLWDGIHTVIRPLGAALVAVTALGRVDPVLTIAAAILCGGIALSSHSGKATARLVVNQSPEPFSNIGLSLGEDAAVVGIAWLAFRHPLITLALVAAVTGLIIWLVPRVVRSVRRRAAAITDTITGQARRGPSPRG